MNFTDVTHVCTYTTFYVMVINSGM